jgi:succinate-semialdehyde dehydrogenase/glutarate-semialdehyde dehydrogenase
MTSASGYPSTYEGRALIDGRWQDAAAGARRAVSNPATDEILAEIAWCGPSDIGRAVDAAARAFPAWARSPGIERARVIRRLYELMIRDQESLAALMTAEQGKPLSESRGEILYAAGFVEWSAEEAKRITGEVVPAFVPNKRILVLRQAIGVTAAITPWNFPAAMITRKLAPALAAGCTMIVKPPAATPLTAIAIGALAIEAGFPPGVVNVVPGESRPIADALLADGRVRALSFTGSTEVGKELMTKAAAHVTKIELELGGHAPFLVFDDADLDAAVTGAIASKFRNAGQTCVCANRIYAQAGIYDRFAAAFSKATAALVVGNGADVGVQIGPLIDDHAMIKVEEHVADAVERGASVLVGGRRLTPSAGLADRFYAPTVVGGVDPSMRIYREETFGPVAPLIRFETEAEAIRMANDTPFGLAAYFYTRDASRLIRVAEALEYGIVGANDALPSTPQAPFGGMKESGLGREGGKWGLDLFLETKFVSVGIEMAADTPLGRNR